MIEAVLFDLDDTLYPQSAWLEGAWRAVADAAPDGIERTALHDALVAVASEGSDRGRIIDRALVLAGAPHLDPAPLVEVFRSHAPSHLDPYPDTVEVLQALRARVPIGLISDGDINGQRAKLTALALSEAFDVIVLSDELGRDRRKPHPAPFLAALEQLRVPASRCVMVGDRPEKDTRGAQAAGLLGSIRLRTGEYADRPDEKGCIASVSNLTEVGACLLRLIDHATPQLFRCSPS